MFSTSLVDSVKKFEKNKERLLVDITIETLMPFDVNTKTAEELQDFFDTKTDDDPFAIADKIFQEVEVISAEILGLNRLILCKAIKKGGILKALTEKTISFGLYSSVRYE